MKKTIIILAVFGLFILAREAFADKLFLKSGSVISGVIKEKNENFVRITVDGNVTRTIFTSRIDRLEYDDSLVEWPQAEGGFNATDAAFEKKQVIRQIIDVSGMKQHIEDNIEQAIFKVPLENRAEFAELFQADEVIKTIEPLYAKYYSEEELGQLLEFYQSPIGQKVVSVTPDITRDAMDAIVTIFQNKLLGK